MVLEIVFWLVTILILYRFNRDLHKDIFPTKRQWKFIMKWMEKNTQ